MVKYISLLLFIGLAWGQVDTLWTNTFGGSSSDYGYCVKQTTDGGYIITGRTDSYGKGGRDFWLIKTDSNGDSTWTKTFGGSSNDEGRSIQQTTDGGYIITGYTRSIGNGGKDFWLIKTDSNGDSTWTRTFGGSGNDYGRSVQQTADGGYVITGSTWTYGNGEVDIWLIKTDSLGQEEWSQIFGGSSNDEGRSVHQTTEGGYIITGSTWSFGNGEEDIWLIKTDSLGQEVWNQTFGGSSGDYGFSVQQTTDGGYIVAGITFSYGNGQQDVWLIKTDINGDSTWTKTFGGSSQDFGYSVQQTTDGGYVITGTTDGNVWLIKTDSLGQEVWNQTLGGSSDDYGWSVQQTADGGYIITGQTDSYGNGGWDVWLIKTDSEDVVEIESKPYLPKEFNAYHNYPNPFNDQTLIQFYLPEKTQTRITVYDILGREIIILSDKILVAGTYTIRWDGRDKVGLKVPTGIYFYRFDTFAFSDVRKMIYLK